MHIKKLHEWSERQKQRVQEVVLLAQKGYGMKSSQLHSFWCAFCGIEILDEAPVLLLHCLNHLCSKTHIDTVYAFYKRNGTNHKEIDQKWFYVGEPFRDEYVDNCKSAMNNEASKVGIFEPKVVFYGPTVQKASNGGSLGEAKAVIVKEKKGIEAQLTKYTYDVLLNGPMGCNSYFGPDATALATLQSDEGVLQNCSGFTATGKRVWGGGIVKCSSTEWKAWPMDLLMIQYYRKQKESQKKVDPVPEEQKEEEDRIYTSSAAGEGLACISLGEAPSAIEGNIHSSALPPWIQKEDNDRIMKEWKKKMDYEQRFNKRFKALDVGVIRGKKASDSWMPNFGGVWNGNSRKSTRESFLNELQELSNHHLHQLEEKETEKRKVVGEESILPELQAFIKDGGGSMSDADKEKLLQKNKQLVFNKIQMRMQNQ